MTSNNINDILKYSIITGLLAILFVPFIIANAQFFPYITGKAFTFRIIVEILFALWVILAFRDRSFLPRFSWVLASLSAFLVIIGLADFFGVDPYKSFWSNYQRMDGFINLIHLFAYFLLASSVLNTKKLWEVFLNTSVFSSLIMCVYGFLQIAKKIEIRQGGVRLDGTLGNAIYLAVFILFNIFFAIFLFVRAVERKDLQSRWHYLYIPTILVQVVILYHTATRGSTLGLLAGIFLSALFIAIFEKKSKKIRLSAIAGIILLLAVVAGFWFVRDSNFVKKSPTLARFSSLSVEEIKTQGRYYVWPMAVAGFKDRPILGWGQDNFIHVFNKYYDPAMYNQEPWFDRAHNIFLDWLISGGALGLLSYLSILFALIYYVFKSSFSVREKAVLIGLIGAYVFQNIFGFDNISSYILFFSLLAFVSFNSSKNSSPISWLEKLAQKENLAQKIISPTVVILIILTIYFVNVKPIMANRNLLLAIDVGRSQPEDSLGYFNKAFTYKTFGSLETGEKMIEFLPKLKSAEAEYRKEFEDETVRYFSTFVESTPEDARVLFFYGSLLNRVGKSVEAIPILEKSLEFSPNKQQIILELGVAYANIGERQTAVEKFRTAYELSPNFSDLKLYYALSAIYAEDFELADSLLFEVDQETLISDERFIFAYVTVGRFDKVVEILKERIVLDSQNPQTYFSLAAAYLKAGSRQLAIAELRKAVTVEPAVRKQAEFYISEIQAGRNPQ